MTVEDFDIGVEDFDTGVEDFDIGVEDVVLLHNYFDLRHEDFGLGGNFAGLSLNSEADFLYSVDSHLHIHMQHSLLSVIWLLQSVVVDIGISRSLYVDTVACPKCVDAGFCTTSRLCSFGEV